MCISCCCYSAPVAEWSIAISLSVSLCVCVCLSVRKHISGLIFMRFSLQIPCGRGSSSTGSVALCYVLPVLSMTSRLAIVGCMEMSMNALLLLCTGVIFVNENENGEKRENNEFINKNYNEKMMKTKTRK